jgi:hypothetical protein
MAAPFARARAIFAMLAAGMAPTNLPVYISRGKGGGATPRSASGVAHAKRLAAKARNVQRHRRACR